jgi:hypothetical protein
MKQKHFDFEFLKEDIEGLYHSNPHLLEKGGRSHALKILKNPSYFHQYKEMRNSLTYQTTHLSAYIKFGCVSIREVYWAFHRNHSIIDQLLWREFYYYLIYYIPEILKRGVAQHEKFNHIEWRKRYYNHYFGCESDNSIEKLSEQLVKNYLIGIKWVTLYYFDKCPSWEWYFPFENPPFISDIKKYLNKVKINNIKFDEGKPLKPFVQLLSVLPQQSNYLLPNNLKKLMTNCNSSLSHLYPIDFEQDYLNKSKYWMIIPKLPPLEIDLIKYIYMKYQDELSKEDNFRNRLCENLIFN